jgi:hypothetical protein
VRHLTEHDVPAWVEDSLLSPRRTKPIVAISTIQGTDRTWIDPEQLERVLGEQADVVVLETGEPTWVLTECLPPLLEVYGGALRIWWPGLTREANPYDHRLYLVRDAAHAEHVQRELVRAIAGTTGTRLERPAGPQPVVRVRVSAMGLDEVEVATLEPPLRRGPITQSDLPIDMLVEQLSPGCQLEARPLEPQPDGRWTFSIAGLLPDAWPRFAAAVKPGDVFTCRVQNLNDAKRLVFVDVLPHLVGVCHVRELDYQFVERLGDFVQPGELVAFQVLEIDGGERRLQLSRKRAFTNEPVPLPALFEGGRPFVWRAGLPWFGRRRDAEGNPLGARAAWRATGNTNAEAAATTAAAQERIGELEQELLAARDERQSLVTQIRQLREQVQEARREQRATDQRAEVQARRGDAADPLASERAFLQAVRLAYARTFDEDDRVQRPLQRMRVGREFLQSVRDTQGVDVDKLVEVCVEVAADIAHKKAGRDVHPLRAGERGAEARTRKRDGAKAWRCALQVNSPSARRLHWWNVPGPAGATIEFACVGVHDCVDIPDA